jgi:hypothetical protein
MTKSIIVKYKTFDFSSADIFTSMTMELAEGDDVKEAGTKLMEAVTEEAFEIKGYMDQIDPQFYKKPKSIQ